MSTWILLRGLTREQRHWGALPEVLRESVKADQVLPVDLPGNGAFAGERAPWDVNGMVGFVRRAVSARRVAAPYRVLAMSLGGMVATAWAQQYPQEIERLVLINTSMRPFSRAPERLRPQAWPGLLQAAFGWKTPQPVERTIHRLTCNDRRTVDRDVTQWCAIRTTAPVSRGNALRQLWAAARFRADRAAPRCPTLILSSCEDKLVNPVCSVRLAAAWGVEHRQHPWAGHDLPHDDPHWTSEAVAAWLARQALPTIQR
jgi:pimeloyl-ACP methyl ester carboxylesterase